MAGLIKGGLRQEWRWRFIARVVRIVDADTIDVEVDVGFRIWVHERIRLADVNAWEMRGPERVKGKEATAFVERLCPVGTEVTIQTIKRGKYGRWIAHVWFPIGALSLTILDHLDWWEGRDPYADQEADLGAVLLKAGHARPYGE